MAIKAIDKKHLSEEEIAEIHDEVKMIQSVDHENIVNYYETYEDKRFIYLCMELCTGGELIANVMEGKSAINGDEQKAKTIIYKLFSALHHVHAKNIIHRDIKPENIMYDSKENGTVKFIDFGLACQFKEGGDQEVAGTPYFIAPEVLSGKYDFKCDTWSMGVVIYLLLTGDMPFDGNN